MNRFVKIATMFLGVSLLFLAYTVTGQANELDPSNVSDYTELKKNIIGDENVEIEQTLARDGTVGVNVTKYFPSERIADSLPGRVGTSYAVTLVLGNISKDEYISKGFGAVEGSGVVDYGGLLTRIDWTSDKWNGQELFGIKTISARAITAPNCGLEGQAVFYVAQLGFNPNTGFNTFQNSWAFLLTTGQEWTSNYVGLDSDFDFLVSDQTGGILEGKTTCTFTKGGNKQVCSAVAKKF